MNSGEIVRTLSQISLAYFAIFSLWFEQDGSTSRRSLLHLEQRGQDPWHWARVRLLSCLYLWNEIADDVLQRTSRCVLRWSVEVGS